MKTPSKPNFSTSYLTWIGLGVERESVNINNIINTVPTVQRTHRVFITKTNRTVVNREIVALCCGNRGENVNALCGQTAEVLKVKQATDSVIAVPQGSVSRFSLAKGTLSTSIDCCGNVRNFDCVKLTN